MKFQIDSQEQRDRMIEQAERFTDTADYIRYNPVPQDVDLEAWHDHAATCEIMAADMTAAIEDWDDRYAHGEV